MSVGKLISCPYCGTGFTLEDILSGRDLSPRGMQIDPRDDAMASFYFRHEAPGCGTTFSVPVTQFREHLDESDDLPTLTGREVCERHCTQLDDISLCGQNCRNAPYRRLLRQMLARQRKSA